MKINGESSSHKKAGKWKYVDGIDKSTESNTGFIICMFAEAVGIVVLAITLLG